MDELRGEAVMLRPLRPDDAEDLAAGCNDPLTQRFLPLLPSPYTLADARYWINEGAPEAFAEGGWAYGFADPATDRLLGGGGVRLKTHGAAEIGYWVAPWARGQGVATAAARLLATHVLAEGVQRLVLRTEPENPASQRVAIAAGFTREGIERGGGRNRDGTRHDLIVWARLTSDPDEPGKRLLPDLPHGELTDGVVSLRPLSEADTQDTYALRTLPEVVVTSVPPSAPEYEHVRVACARAQAGWLAGQRADLTIRDAATGRHAGEIGLYYWEPKTQQAMIGYSLGRDFRGAGFTTRAVRLITSWGFDQVGLVRIVAGTAPENLASQRVLERVGFVREGYQRSRLPGVNGTRIDDVQWALLRP
jgi:RimJ/RimL family protein N-acetyltransferase